MSPAKTPSIKNQPRRSSRRLQGLAPQIEFPSPTSVYLPPELKVAVLAQLNKTDLKSVRLVSKEWNLLATRPLFDRVYISCREKDLEVFRNVTGHPVISEGVRELVCDNSMFKWDMEFEEYFENVAEEMSWNSRGWSPGTPFDSSDAQINRFYQYCRRKTISYPKFYNRHKRDTFLVEGYQKYRDNSVFEFRCILSGSFFDELRTGLESLNSLRSVVFSHKFWYSQTPKPDPFHTPFSGSPLCRSWNPFHLRPCGWRNLPDIDNARHRSVAQFNLLTGAIRATSKEITSLQIPDDDLGEGLPQQAWIRSNLSDNFHWHLMTAYSRLRCLEIYMIAYNPDHKEALTVIPELLMQMRGLRRLSLHLLKDSIQLLPTELGERHRYDEIFPINGFWPELTELSLSGLAIRGWDLLMLIRVRARVRQLKLSNINLLHGTWEGVVEGMRCPPRLCELTMDADFKHCGGAIFSPGGRRWRHTDSKFLYRIADYVVNGGRHPCLSPESDADIALGWYYDLIPEETVEEWRLWARENDKYSEELFHKRK